MPLPKLSFLLTAMNISTIYSAHGDRIGSAPITCKFQMGELHMEISYTYNSVGLHYITMLSNCIGLYPLEKVERYSLKDQRKTKSVGQV